MKQYPNSRLRDVVNTASRGRAQLLQAKLSTRMRLHEINGHDNGDQHVAPSDPTEGERPAVTDTLPGRLLIQEGVKYPSYCLSSPQAVSSR